MQFTKPFKEAIAAGRVTSSLRTWKKPQVRIGGRYNIPPYGAIEVTGLTELAFAAISTKKIAQSGFTDAQALRDYLQVQPTDLVYQVDFRYLGKAAVNKPSTANVTLGELEQLQTRLARMDGATPWTHTALTLIAAQPGTRAADLAPACHMDKPTFKRNIRKLKALGLTLSLATGYEISTRGRQLLEHWDSTS